MKDFLNFLLAVEASVLLTIAILMWALLSNHLCAHNGENSPLRCVVLETR